MSQHIPAIYEDGVLKPLGPLQLAEHQQVWLSVEVRPADSPRAEGEETFLDAASRLGFVGCIKGTPPDLSTNKEFMNGFGTSDA